MPRISVSVVSSAVDVETAMAIWAAADLTLPRPAGPARSERVRDKVERGEVVLLAHYGERAAGMALAESFDDGSTDPSTGHVSMVYVDPALWGSGVGGRLLRDLKSRWPRLSVWVRPENRRAGRLFASGGFADVGNVSHLQDGEEIRQLVWAAGPRARSERGEDRRGSSGVGG